MARNGKLNRFAENDFHNRIELCVAYVAGADIQKGFVLKSNPTAEAIKFLDISNLCKRAVEIYCQDFEEVDWQTVRISYYRWLESNGVSNKTTATKK